MWRRSTIIQNINKEVVLVTGTTSGIGEAIAIRLLELGAKVLGVSRREKCNISHKNFLYVRGDISDYNSCLQIKEKAIDAFGKVTILINCAGYNISGNLEDLSCEEFKDNFKVNVYGTFYMCKAFIEELKKHRSRIINISSDMSIKAMKSRVGYNPSKAALNMMTKCMALDYAPNIKVNAILPGVVKTPLYYERLNRKDNPREREKLYESWYPLNRVGSVDDIVNATIFLCSNSSDFVTGSLIRACGGSFLY